jgi:hypothetical protein
VGVERTSILFLSADPSDASRMRLGQELRDLETRLRLASARDALELHHRASVRPGDLTQALFDTRPAIVHFSGHGVPSGALCLENDRGQIHPVSPEALEALFALFEGQVHCVVLNACYSHTQAMAIARHIDHVVGMTQAITDQAAIAFSSGFYKALAAGRSIPDCFEFGRTELRLFNLPEFQIPVLLRRPRVRHLFLEESQYVTQRSDGFKDIRFPSEYDLFAKLTPSRGEPRGCILVDPEAYGSIRDLLDDLYVNYLHDRVPVLSYGERWLLSVGRWPELLVAPWYWFSRRGTTLRDDLRVWLRTTTPAAAGLHRGSHAGVLLPESDLRREDFLVIATNLDVVHEIATTQPKGLALLARELVTVPPEEFDGERYRHAIVLSCHFGVQSGIYVDPPSTADLLQLADMFL